MRPGWPSRRRPAGLGWCDVAGPAERDADEVAVAGAVAGRALVVQALASRAATAGATVSSRRITMSAAYVPEAVSGGSIATISFAAGAMYTS